MEPRASSGSSTVRGRRANERVSHVAPRIVVGAQGRPEPGLDDERRRYYRLTELATAVEAIVRTGKPTTSFAGGA
jgi:hypothetical protein